MNGIEFFSLIEDNLIQYILILLCCVTVYYLLFRKWIISIFDPILFVELYASFAASVVIFLWTKGYVDNNLGIHFVLTELAFIFGFRSCKSCKLIKVSVVYKTLIRNQSKKIYLFLSLVLIFSILFTYIKLGIPLFLDSRLELYDDSGGLGVFGRIIDVLQIVVLTYSFYIIVYNKLAKKLKNTVITVIAIICISLFLSGSKSAMILPFYVLFILALTVNGRFLNIIKHKGIVLSLIIISSLIIIIIQSDSQTEAILSLMRRLVSSGDTFYQAYPSGIIYHIKGGSMDFILGPFLKTFRIIDYTEDGIGNQIFWQMTHNSLNAGPNPRISVLTYVCFGYYKSIIACYIFGIITSIIRNKLSQHIYKNPLVIGFYAYVYIRILVFPTDITWSVTNLTNLIIVGFLCGIFILLYNVLKINYGKPKILKHDTSASNIISYNE